jgi:glycosyltransferase involved in cell wall biosynthesis
MDRAELPQIVVDFESLRMPNCGLGRFAMHLGQALLQHSPPDIRFTLLLPESGKPYFPAELLGGTHEVLANRKWHRYDYSKWVPSLAWRQWGGPMGDLWHVTNQHSHFWPPSRSIPTLLTIHDLNFLREKSPSGTARRVRKLQRLVDRSSAIATISEFSAAEIREHLHLRGKPLRVIYNGLAAPRVPKSDPLPDLPPGPFLFTIGDITAKKNFHVLLDLMSELPEYRLVIAGRKASDYARHLQKTVAQRKLTHRVFLPGEIDDAQRQWLYEHCDAFLFPSLTEGFGLPVIEAMSFGKPVFITRGTSLPEIGGSLAYYWDRFEPKLMVDCFRAGLEQTKRDPDFARRSQQHASQFSWSRAAAAYLDYYRDLLSIQGHSHQRAA